MNTVKIELGYTPRKWQLECNKAMKRFTVLVVHRQAGKTELAIMYLISHALANNNHLYGYIAPFQNQATGIVWSRLKKMLEPMRDSGVYTIAESTKSVKFYNGTIIRLFGADNDESIRGYHFHGVVLDEVSQIKPDVWYSIIQPTLSSTLGSALFIGTPNGLNLLSELYEKGLQGNDNWISMRYNVHETGVLRADEVRRLKQDTPQSQYEREFLCDFGAKADDQLISFEEASQARKRYYQPDSYSFAPRILGVDPARHGDRSVLFKRQGLVAFEPIAYENIDNMTLADRIAWIIMEWQPDAVFIDSGGGVGVIDRLRQLGHDVIEVPFGSSPRNKVQFLNRRMEMWWDMREWIRSGGALPEDLTLQAELTTPRYSWNARDQKLLEPKEDVISRLGRSPDLADALALTFASPVNARSFSFAQTKSRKDAMTYCPCFSDDYLETRELFHDR